MLAFSLVCVCVPVLAHRWCLSITVSLLRPPSLPLSVSVCRLIQLAAARGNFSLAPQKLVSQALIVAPSLCISP